MEQERTADAVMVKLRDGKEYEILFTMGSIRRIEKLPKVSETYTALDNALDTFCEGFRITNPELITDKDALADLIDMKHMDQMKAAFDEAMGKATLGAAEVAGTEAPKQ